MFAIPHSVNNFVYKFPFPDIFTGSSNGRIRNKSGFLKDTNWSHVQLLTLCNLEVTPIQVVDLEIQFTGSLLGEWRYNSYALSSITSNKINCLSSQVLKISLCAINLVLTLNDHTHHFSPQQSVPSIMVFQVFQWNMQHYCNWV